MKEWIILQRIFGFFQRTHFLGVVLGHRVVEENVFLDVFGRAAQLGRNRSLDNPCVSGSEKFWDLGVGAHEEDPFKNPILVTCVPASITRLLRFQCFYMESSLLKSLKQFLEKSLNFTKGKLARMSV